ncbi:hypothetical protein QBC45DRAFT_489226 [Copromyces sp. CBS 386.78]|nr:hypothetical protein QBC45DRAFT_489226 [Copromyces sp. CBS 386.78]
MAIGAQVCFGRILIHMLFQPLPSFTRVWRNMNFLFTMASIHEIRFGLPSMGNEIYHIGYCTMVFTDATIYLRYRDQVPVASDKPSLLCHEEVLLTEFDYSTSRGQEGTRELSNLLSWLQVSTVGAISFGTNLQGYNKPVSPWSRLADCTGTFPVPFRAQRCSNQHQDGDVGFTHKFPASWVTGEAWGDVKKRMERWKSFPDTSHFKTRRYEEFMHARLPPLAIQGIITAMMRIHDLNKWKSLGSCDICVVSAIKAGNAHHQRGKSEAGSQQKQLHHILPFIQEPDHKPTAHDLVTKFTNQRNPSRPPAICSTGIFIATTTLISHLVSTTATKATRPFTYSFRAIQAPTERIMPHSVRVNDPTAIDADLQGLVPPHPLLLQGEKGGGLG